VDDASQTFGADREGGQDEQDDKNDTVHDDGLRPNGPSV
jgi:hypothetical protein